GLVEPVRLTRVGITRENAGGPLVVARPLIGVPRTRVAGAVVDEVELRVVADPSPGPAPTLLPRVGRPGRHAEVLTLVAGKERLELGTNQNVAVGTGGVGL